MFNKDFYPTPEEAFYLMIQNTNLKNRTILDPSAGKGDLLRYASRYNKNQKYAYEIEPELRSITQNNGHRILGNDFLEATGKDISNIDLILMNPPFSVGDKHIIHAWNIAPDGCEIIALCNTKTLENLHSKYRMRLQTIIHNNGVTKNLGSVFIDAERKTNVEVSLIHLFKPKKTGEFDYSMFFLTDEEEEQLGGTPGLMSYNEIRAIVNNYVASIKKFEEIEKTINQINKIGASLGFSEYDNLECTFGDKKGFISVHEYARELQKLAWKKLIERFGLKKYFTSKVNERLDKMINSQIKIPFTMKNIYVLIDIIFQTREQNLNEALAGAVDSFTRHTHKNRFNVEGWKTNSGHMLNKKFIINSMVNTDFGFRIPHGGLASENMDDLLKVLCNLTGVNYNHIPHITFWLDGDKKTNTWYQLKTNPVVDKEGKVIRPSKPIFLEYKFFLKGTMHVKFIDDKVWELLNRSYAKVKGQDLPEKL